MDIQSDNAEDTAEHKIKIKEIDKRLSMVDIVRINVEIIVSPNIKKQCTQDKDHNSAEFIVYLFKPVFAVIEVFVNIDAKQKGADAVGSIQIGISEKVCPVAKRPRLSVNVEGHGLHDAGYYRKQHHELKDIIVSLPPCPGYKTTYKQK